MLIKFGKAPGRPESSADLDSQLANGRGAERVTVEARVIATEEDTRSWRICGSADSTQGSFGVDIACTRRATWSSNLSKILVGRWDQ